MRLPAFLHGSRCTASLRRRTALLFMVLAWYLAGTYDANWLYLLEYLPKSLQGSWKWTTRR